MTFKRLHTAITVCPDDCVTAAISAVTGERPELWIEKITKKQGHSFPGHGALKNVYGPMLQEELGMTRVSMKYPGVPLHLACASLKGCVGILIVGHNGWFSTHAIAAQGFILADNHFLRPLWYADWLDAWRKMVRREGWPDEYLELTVQHAFVAP